MGHATVSTPTGPRLADAHQEYPATATLTYMDVAARGLMSRQVRAALDRPELGFVLPAYPGYEGSPGTPRQETILKDAVLWWRFLASEEQVPPGRLFVMGQVTIVNPSRSSMVQSPVKPSMRSAK